MYPFSRALIILFLMLVLVTAVYFADIGLVYTAVVAVAFLPPLFFYALSPLFTRHRMSPEGLELRQGWYFHAFISAGNVKEVGHSEEEAPPRSLSFSPRRGRLYVTLSRGPLVYIDLRDPARLPYSSGRPVSTVVLSVDEPDRFLQGARTLLGARVVPDRTCPECRRPLESGRTGRKEEPAPRHEPSRIEYIFLIHHDGRLVFQYAGGRLRPVKTSAVSGMLLVIQDFIRDAFKTEGGALRKLEHGDLSILIETGSRMYLAVVISGQEDPSELREAMKRVLREIEQDYADRFRDWDGKVPDGLGRVISQVLWA